jgi:sugar transferase EpsL
MDLRRLTKRAFDLFLGSLCLFLSFPLLVIIWALVRMMLGSPVLFQQQRPGLYSEPFIIYKFRSMTDDRDKKGGMLADAKRLTTFGRLLRTTSLDELPELFNVLKGEMSLVGPRPLLMDYLKLYTPEQSRRNEVKPGITGWAQINGRNNLSWEDKFKLDIWYVDHWSLRLDMKIILKTIIRILSHEGINQPGQATAEKFKGSI